MVDQKKGRDIFISIKIRLKIIVHLTKYYKKNIQKNNKSMRKKCIFLLLLLLNLHQLLLKTLEIHSAREDLKKIKLHTKNFLFWDLCEKKIHTYLISTLPGNFDRRTINPKNFARHIDYAAATLKKRSLKTNTITGQFI